MPFVMDPLVTLTLLPDETVLVRGTPVRLVFPGNVILQGCVDKVLKPTKDGQRRLRVRIVDPEDGADDASSPLRGPPWHIQDEEG